MPILLEPQHGKPYVNAGESAVVTGTFYDTSGETLALAAIKTLTMTLKDSVGNIINSRDGTDIKNTGIGAVAADGTVTVKLNSTDNAFQGASGLLEETHSLLLTWTWDDDDDDELTGREEFEFKVRTQPW